MANWIDSFVDAGVQCWGCEVFDSLFQVVSAAGAALYDRMAQFGMILLAVFIAFYVLYSVWTNLSKGAEDFTYQKYFKPVLINSLLVVALLGAGVWLPRFVTSITMEPVADITLLYTQSMLNKTPGEINEKVPYESAQMPEDGFYRPQLRDKILELIRTSTTQFQAMIKLGLHVMDGAFKWSAITGIGALVKHVIMFFMGLALVWGFFKLFVKFCFYFVDIIISLSFFAFFFPLGLVFFVFRNPESAGWVKDLGKKIAPGMLKSAIGSIVTLATVVITYVVIMVLMARFLANSDVGGTELANQIMSGSGDIYAAGLDADNMAMMTLMGCIVLLYVVQFIAGQINKVAKDVIDTFGIEAKADLEGTVGDALGKDALALTGNIVKGVADKTKIALGIGKESA